MIEKIHILGAAGSGTTTLGRTLAVQLGYQHFDTDHYFWLPTKPPFQVKRDVQDRQQFLAKDLDSADRWILSGSLCGWGDIFIPKFELVVYLWIPKDLRMERLLKREIQRYGAAAVKANGKRHAAANAFLEWAAGYDEGGLNMRSKMLHEQWLAALPCKVLRLEGDLSVEERAAAIHTCTNVP
ncbi:hypothetical protein SPTER_06080 [Sporomusa termitida]|uniref:Shikimate kinase n=1 Tax=Sporomusa termitida TaxID=2377 RepID=A0A517DPN9_9FIRM|nr:hypothetical protein SPTER_06080 [Sporomusa termitida]